MLFSFKSILPLVDLISACIFLDFETFIADDNVVTGKFLLEEILVVGIL